MIRKIPQLKPDVFYVGLNDRKTGLFENIWPIETGVAYNSYLITDQKTALIDTVDTNMIMDYIIAVQQCLQGRKLDYIIINHMEPDHCGGILIIQKYFPEVKIIGNKKTFEILSNFYGVVENLVEIKEGEELDLGSRKLQFFMAPMVHWPEVMMTWDTKDQTLFTADAFGSYGTLDGGITDEQLDIALYDDEFIRYYSNIVGKFSNPVQAVLKKMKHLPVKMIASTHGPIFTKQENIAKIFSLYDKLSRNETDPGVVIAFASMYGNTEAMADVIGRQLAEQGIKNIRIYDVSKTHPSYIIRDVFKFKGLILGSSTYNLDLHPNMHTLISELEAIGIKNHIFGCFGTFSWAGRAAKKLEEFGQRMGWEMISPCIEEKGSLKIDKYDECIAMADAMAKKIMVNGKL